MSAQESEQSSYNPEDYPLRNALLELIREKEFSDRPMRTFKIRSNTGCFNEIDTTIYAKTRLGAAITLIDLITAEIKHGRCKSMDGWHEYEKQLVGDLYSRIEYKKTHIIDELFLEEYYEAPDICLVEKVKAHKIKLMLFPSTNVKAARS